MFAAPCCLCFTRCQYHGHHKWDLFAAPKPTRTLRSLRRFTRVRQESCSLKLDPENPFFKKVTMQQVIFEADPSIHRLEKFICYLCLESLAGEKLEFGDLNEVGTIQGKSWLQPEVTTAAAAGASTASKLVVGTLPSHPIPSHPIPSHPIPSHPLPLPFPPRNMRNVWNCRAPLTTAV